MTPVRRVLLKGFYGFGNLGDDILMLTTYNIVKEVFPKAQILVSSESKNPEYVHKFLGDVTIVTSTDNVDVDWIIHGGGGVFFDFKNHSVQNLITNTIIKSIGYTTYRILYSQFRKFKGTGVTRFKRRVGLGIGVGTYTRSSNKFFFDINALSTFDMLLVRDKESVENARKYCSSERIYKFSDLAFLNKYWLPGFDAPVERNAIGIILRDWEFDNNVEVIIQTAKELIAKGHKVKFFALDEDTDVDYIQMAKEIGPTFIWNPTLWTLDNYIHELSGCRLVVSSRAHGAIIPSCLGIPVCCVCIEPKLEKVVAMLKSAYAIRKPYDKDLCLKTVERAISNQSEASRQIMLDASENTNEMMNGLETFRKFVHKFEKLE